MQRSTAIVRPGILSPMEFAKLVLLCIVSVCAYGGIAGEISALICPEAFTLGRPPVFEKWPALALGPIWGVLDLLLPATVAGLALAMAANIGHHPTLKAAFFHRVLPGLVGVMALAAISAGALGFFTTRSGAYEILGPMRDALPIERHPLLAAVWWAALGGLSASFVGAVVLAMWTWRKRAYFGALLAKR